MTISPCVRAEPKSQSLTWLKSDLKTKMLSSLTSRWHIFLSCTQSRAEPRKIFVLRLYGPNSPLFLGQELTFANKWSTWSMKWEIIRNLSVIDCYWSWVLLGKIWKKEKKNIINAKLIEQKFWRYLCKTMPYILHATNVMIFPTWINHPIPSSLGVKSTFGYRKGRGFKSRLGRKLFYLFFGNFIYGNCKLWRAKCQSVSNRAFVLRATTRASKDP